MKESLRTLEHKINAFTVRERALILITLLAVIGFSWWHFYAEPLTIKTNTLATQNDQLAREVQVAQSSAAAISKRIQQGVHKNKEEKLKTLRVELKRVNEALKQKTLELIEPDEMFELMLQLITADSKLKLTGLKRNQLKPVFIAAKNEGPQPEIFRHVMNIEFEGKYQDILAYISRLEGLEWKLIWDEITLTSETYPLIHVSIEISTLSDSKYWVGL